MAPPGTRGMSGDSEPPPQAPGSAPGGVTINITGNHNNVAADGSSITQEVPAIQGYHDLVAATHEALDLLRGDAALDSYDRKIADDAGEVILGEIGLQEPDRLKMKRAATILRGSFTPAGRAASSMVDSVIQRLVVPEPRGPSGPSSVGPRISMGFLLPGFPRHPQSFVSQADVPVLWSAGEFMSEPVVLRFGVANEGDRTATGLSHEVACAGEVSDVVWDERDADYYCDETGLHHVLWNEANLHPREGLTHYVQIRVSKLASRLAVRSRAGYQDSRWVESRIELRPSFRPFP